MASSFGRYQGGIEASTGNLVPAAGQMAQQTYGAMAGLGQNLAEGIKQYNENSAKSEMANQKLQSLGQAYAEKIAMYSKDPEIAQSGILDGLMATAKSLSEAPTKGFSQRAQIAMDAEAKLAGFGGQLQEMMFLRGRQMERVTQQGLELAAGSKTVTDPRLTRELKLDPNKTLQQNKEGALAYLNKVRQVNPKLEGSDEDFLASVLNGYEQTASKADPNLIPASVTSSLLEQIASEKRLLKSKKESQQTGLVEDFLARGKQSSRADFEKTNTAASDAMVDTTQKAKEFAPNWLLERAKKEIGSSDVVRSGLQASGSVVASEVLNSMLAKVEAGGVVTPKDIRESLIQSEQKNNQLANPEPIMPSFTMGSSSQAAAYTRLGFMRTPDPVFTPAASAIMKAVKDTKLKDDQPLSANDVLTLSNKISPKIDEFKKASDRLVEQSKNVKLPQEQKAKAPVLEVGDVVLGSVTEEQKLGVRERQKQVADFVTSRMGAIDPTDPERKRRMPVVGFDKFYESLVPESEIREFTTDSGMRVVRMNGKWEQIKSEKPMTNKELREQNFGVFGKQTSQGLVPSEIIPDSGVFVGGLFNGSDASVTKYQEEIPKLIDARRGVRELQRINDLVGEAVMPVERGKALVEEMNLAAMLRTDIVGVGTVSNYEQKLIKDVTERSVNFFSLEAQDRAVLIALAQRVDRRIKNLSAVHGLTTIIKDDTGGNKYQALREQYLREKGIL
jgi:hypothetical protein